METYGAGLEGVVAAATGQAQVDEHEVLVRVQSGWGWQIRCVEAELRGGATVLTYVRSQPC